MKYPVTPAIRILRQQKVSFEPHLYRYEEQGGTSASSQALGVPETEIVKTLIMEDDSGKPLIVLMTGDRQVSTKELARTLGVKAIKPCQPKIAQKHSGYMVGGTSPFGTRARMPVYVEKCILALPRIFINGGKRGFLVEIDPQDLQKVLQPTLVQVGIQSTS